MPVVCHPCSAKVFPDVQTKPPVPVCAHCLKFWAKISGHGGMGLLLLSSAARMSHTGCHTPGSYSESKPGRAAGVLPGRTSPAGWNVTIPSLRQGKLCILLKTRYTSWKQNQGSQRCSLGHGTPPECLAWAPAHCCLPTHIFVSLSLSFSVHAFITGPQIKNFSGIRGILLHRNQAASAWTWQPTDWAKSDFPWVIELFSHREAARSWLCAGGACVSSRRWKKEVFSSQV